MTIPLEDFFRTPDKVMVRVSPDGTHLAWLAPWERRLNVHVMRLADGATRRITDARERDVAGYFWASDRRLVYARDRGGDENYRLYAVDREGGETLDLTPFPDVKCDLVDDLRDADDEILFQMNRRRPEVFDAWRANVRTGELTLVAENPGNVQSWIPDHRGRLRAAVTTDGVRTAILARDDAESPWRTVAQYDFKEGAQPQSFTPDVRDLYVASNVGRDKYVVRTLDLRSGELGPILFEHPEVDVAQTVYSRAKNKLVAAVYETDRVGFHFFDPEREALQRRLDAALPDRENRIASASRDESVLVVYSGGDRTMGAYHLLRAPDAEPEKLFDVSPWLDEAQMAPMRPVEYTSRDGRTIHGYLTRPDADLPGPLVMLPHGGPWHRDSWGFHPEVQFLASRGYAVLQVNFRGSTGYGRAFWEAGFGEWGRAMQDDVSDGVRWAVETGVADAERVAIYGGSYGGYAALSGLTKTPELYACGISYVGVSNLFTWIESIPPYWKLYLEMLYEMVGHPERDAERFRATSPLFRVDRIRAPLLVAQGANDPRVPQRESDQIVEALRARGIEVEYLVKEDEGHGFRNEENRFEFYRALERFLDAHLAGR